VRVVRRQDIDVKKGGIFAMIFNDGTLVVQAAGTERNLRLPMVPSGERYRDMMMQQVDLAARRVTTVLESGS
jgi:hypothetical protein